jgi:hypothetical protein
MARHDSAIRAICDLTQKRWRILSSMGDHSLIGSELEVAGAWFQICFRNNDKLPVTFDNIHYGYSIIYNGETVSTGEWPPEGLTLHDSDQDFEQEIRCEFLIPGEKYQIYCWAQNGADMIEVNYTLSVPGYTLD